MKRLIFVILVVTAISISVQAKPFPFSGGSGTADDPYRIATASDILELAGDTGDYDANFVVTADIDLTGYTFTTAVIARDTNNLDQDFQGVAFTGVFDGNDHAIRNLTINTGGAGNGYLGLFGYVDGGTIKDLRLENISIAGGDGSIFIGGLVGNDWSASSISNCSSTGVITSGDNSQAVGGLVGIEAGDFSDCYSSITVTSGNNSSYIGGLIGQGYIISNCYSTGNVICGNASFEVGGLVGYSNGSISNCHSTGNVTGGTTSYSLGGLVGENWRGEISKSFSTGNVSSGNDSGRIGGLIGYNDEASIVNCYTTGAIHAEARAQRVGGLVGNNYGYSTGAIVNCYSTGVITWGADSNYIGGLIGLNTQSNLSNCYFLDTSGPNNSYGTPLTDAQMKQQASFVGWDFAGEKKNGTEDIWFIYEGLTYPLLSWVQVTKCTVAAGRNIYTDKISVSGQLDSIASDCFVNGNVIEITIKSNHMNEYFEPNFPINDKTFKRGKYSCSKIDKGALCSFKYDTKTRKFALSGNYVDLSGLDCNIMMHMWIGTDHITTVFGEEIVNGKKPMPISLMMGVENALRVDKIQVKQGKNKNSDQLMVTGGFAMKNTNVDIAGSDLNIGLNGKPYTIAAGKLIAKKNGFGCSNVVLGDGFSIGSADFNFKTCTFKVMIKKTDIQDGLSGLIDFGITFGVDFDENVNVLLR